MVLFTSLIMSHCLTNSLVTSYHYGFIVVDIIIIIIIVHYANNSAKLIIKSKLKYKIHAQKKYIQKHNKTSHQHPIINASTLRMQSCPMRSLLSYDWYRVLNHYKWTLGLNSDSVPTGWYQKNEAYFPKILPVFDQ